MPGPTPYNRPEETVSDDPTVGSQLPVRRPGGGPRAHLEAKAGPEKGETFRLAPEVTLIGRDPSCDIQLSESAISRRHCRIDHLEDQWVLRNLSSNGTRIKRRQIQEHVLSDGDEIRLGAATRLLFVLEEQLAPTGARPQFRPRAAGGEPELPPEEEEEGESPDDEAAPSLFQRRRGLFIGLGTYLLVLLVGAILASIYLKGDGGAGHDSGIPRLALEKRIVPPGGSEPLRIDHTSPSGIWCVDNRGERILISHEDLHTGRARRVPGIRQAIDVEFLTPTQFKRRRRRNEIPPHYPYVLEGTRSRTEAKRLTHEAIQAYLVCDVPGNEKKLYYAVRFFQKALAHYGMRFLPDPAKDKIRQQATKKLINRVHDLYRQAIRSAKAGAYDKAIAAYDKILDYVPERGNLIYENVSRRLDAVQRKLRESRQ